MQPIQNVSPDDRVVPGLGGRMVVAGQIIEVDDADAEGYLVQPSVWATPTEGEAA